MAAPNTTSQPRNSGRRTNKARNRGQKQNDTANTAPVGGQSPALDVVEDENGNETKPTELEGLNEDDDAETCWICAESVKFYSLSECNHRTCHVCALRLRALYKKLECTFCKVGFLLSLYILNDHL